MLIFTNYSILLNITNFLENAITLLDCCNIKDMAKKFIKISFSLRIVHALVNYITRLSFQLFILTINLFHLFGIKFVDKQCPVKISD